MIYPMSCFLTLFETGSPSRSATMWQVSLVRSLIIRRCTHIVIEVEAQKTVLSPHLGLPSPIGAPSSCNIVYTSRIGSKARVSEAGVDSVSLCDAFRDSANFVNGGNGGESCSIRLWEREAYVLEGARTSPNGEVRESKHAVEPGANNTGPCGRSHGRQISVPDPHEKIDWRPYLLSDP
jgi:hypothetical protein